MLKFLTGEPALLIEKALVVAVLHIGIEHEFRQAGLKVPSQLEEMVKRIDALLEKNRAKKLIILGDVKHKVPGISWQEEREVPGFFSHFKVPVEVVPGNHDGGLKDLAPGVKIHPSSGIMVGNTWLCHGHAWPHKDFLKARQVVIAHSHPRLEFRSRLGYRWMEPVWVRAGLDKKKLARRFKEVKKAPELVVMPAFNPFAGGISVNRKMKEKELLGPVIKCARMKKAGLYLLDGTFLGELEKFRLD